MILRQSSEGGVLSPKEVEMVYNVFQLGDIPVKVIMVPRTEILAFDVQSTLKHVVKKIAIHPHSRFPVYENTIDNIVGFIHVKDIYRALIKKGDSAQLSQLKIIRDVITVPEIKKIDAVLQEMRKKRIHLAVVSDEFGGTAGVITLEDIIESLVGEIDDEFDQPNKDITKQKDGSYIIQGYTPIEDMRKKFKLVLRGQGYATIGGLVFGLLGHEPRIGDEVQISNLHLEIKQVDGKRIKSLKVKRLRKRTP
jgi:CBS domain containing-hemolysin-like protein